MVSLKDSGTRLSRPSFLLPCPLSWSVPPSTHPSTPPLHLPLLEPLCLCPKDSLLAFLIPPCLGSLSRKMSSTLPEELPDGGYELSCDWLLNPPRPREAIFGDDDKDRICRMVEEYEENPLEESHFFSKRRAKEIDDIWRHWQKYVSLAGRDPDQVWVDVCTGREGTAKPYFQAFLTRYVEASITLRPCLGPKEWEKVQTIRCAVTLEDVWSTLVAAANINVIKPRRRREPWNAQFIALSYSSQKKQSQNATIRDIGRVSQSK